jgi:hypothetical protein
MSYPVPTMTDTELAAALVRRLATYVEDPDGSVSGFERKPRVPGGVELVELEVDADAVNVGTRTGTRVLRDYRFPLADLRDPYSREAAAWKVLGRSVVP